MEARLLRAIALMAAIASLGASYRSANFLVTAPSEQLAKEIGQAAEQYRRTLAVDWLGKQMPKWSQPCPITAHVAGNLGAGGATSFLFERGEVYGWRMTIQGSRERILDSVLPHEVTHTIFASHFRQPLPRWADEGACTTVEHSSERAKQQTMLIDFLRTGHGIPFSRMFAMKEYPHDVMPLYSQGYSLTRYLIFHGGKQKFLNFLRDGLQDENWPRATKKYYGYAGLGMLQTSWLDWVRRGSPHLQVPSTAPNVGLNGLAQNDASGSDLEDVTPPAPPRDAASSLASANAARSRPAPNLIFRGQNQDSVGDAGLEPVAGGKSTGSGSPAAEDTDGQLASTYPVRPDAWHAPEDVNAASPARGALASTDRGRSMPPTQPYQATRMQPFEQPRQIILEWTRPAGSVEPAAGGLARRP